MGNDTRDTSAGVSFRDVGNLLRQIGKEHNGRAGYNLDLPVRSDNGIHLAVRCYFKRRTGGDGTWVDCYGVSGNWPSGSSATFAGLLFRLAYELSAKLEQEEREAERAASSQRRML